jgi:arginase family enzyme
LPKLLNVGHRELLLLQEDIGKYYAATFPAEALSLNPEPALRRVRRESRKARRVFIDIDCDVFDAAYLPGITQPIPFGLSPPQVLRTLDAAWSPRVAGVAITEFDPGHDREDRSLATLMWLLEYLLLRRHEPKSS